MSSGPAAGVGGWAPLGPNRQPSLDAAAALLQLPQGRAPSAHSAHNHPAATNGRQPRPQQRSKPRGSPRRPSPPPVLKAQQPAAKRARPAPADQQPHQPVQLLPASPAALPWRPPGAGAGGLPAAPPPAFTLAPFSGTGTGSLNPAAQAAAPAGPALSAADVGGLQQQLWAFLQSLPGQPGQAQQREQQPAQPHTPQHSNLATSAVPPAQADAAETAGAKAGVASSAAPAGSSPAEADAAAEAAGVEPAGAAPPGAASMAAPQPAIPPEGTVASPAAAAPALAAVAGAAGPPTSTAAMLPPGPSLPPEQRQIIFEHSGEWHSTHCTLHRSMDPVRAGSQRLRAAFLLPWPTHCFSPMCVTHAPSPP